ncbi:hypothetical protein [Luteibacter yeojuensis]|uniref:Secreted protein n=1 Tax=Luteibacter yeojuensis TaxID=345309 RepID=A0A7X5QUT1_9GAMM|nr:hypothetical protein [Luteibacter yeojuensis]NID15817.1 hypothetical protein [Luteibacter yeojuensis]
MNARPYIFGCLCLVGATGTAAAYDIDPTASGLLASSGSGSSVSFEGSARSTSQGARDNTGGGDAVPSRPVRSHRGNMPPPVTTPVDVDDGTHDDAMPLRSSAPSWQSLLPGSML